MSIAWAGFDKERGSFVLILIPVLMLVIGIAVFGWVWWSRSQGDRSELVVTMPAQTPVPVESTSEAKICAQVITPAVDPVTGQCREFGTPCEVPGTFKALESCNPEGIMWQKYSPSNGVFSMYYPQSWDFFVRQTSIGVLGSTNLITQVAFDNKATGKRNPFGELLGRVELSWLGSSGYEGKLVKDFTDSYYHNAEPVVISMKVGVLEVVRVEHKNCSANKGCIDYVFKHQKTFYVLRALSSGDKSEDEKIIVTMLNSWRFLVR